MKSGSLCALVWRLLSWCHPRGIVLRARHIPGHLNVIADKLSRHNQSDSNRVVPISAGIQSFVLQMGPTSGGLVCNPVQSQTSSVWITGTGSGSLSLPWENMDVYAFPPVSLIPQVISKKMVQGCGRMILIVPVWPNMPWFWDLVNLSVQIPLSLPLQRDLVTQQPNSQEPQQS